MLVGMENSKRSHGSERVRAGAAGGVGMSRRRRGFLPALLATALLAGCTAAQVGDFLHAGGKIAYDSFRGRQQAD
jgi:hypothetical protein